MSSSYTELLEAKTGELIPAVNGCSLHSKYNPQREAQSFAEGFDHNQLFFVIGGIAGAYHIIELLKINPERFIIAVENSQEDIDFLMDIPAVKKLSTCRNVIFATPKTLFNSIIEKYLPALYGNINSVNLRSWENLFPEGALQVKAVLEAALQSVKADFSVQSRFGKIWQRNIFNNLKIAGSLNKSFSDFQKSVDKEISKTAAVIAAGPSFDDDIKELKENRNNYFIISTDTAYTALTKRGITADAVVSVDGQAVSSSHFLKSLNSKTIFVMDLCSCSGAVNKVLKNNCPLLFFESGHPLAVLAASYSNSFIHLNTGSGTVTIAALDLAKKLGFKNYRIFGADFAYSKGKAYTSGTYLDELYMKNQTRSKNSETSYDRLLFRTELIALKDGVFTTPVLESYSKSMDFYLANLPSRYCEKTLNFNFERFNKQFCEELKLLPPKLEDASSYPVFYALLPLMAHLEQSLSAQESYELARRKALQYN